MHAHTITEIQAFSDDRQKLQGTLKSDQIARFFCQFFKFASQMFSLHGRRNQKEKALWTLDVNIRTESLKKIQFFLSPSPNY